LSDSTPTIFHTLNVFLDESSAFNAADLEAAAGRTRDAWDAWVKDASDRLASVGQQDALDLLEKAEQLFAGM
jgi:hypothetical protein